MSTLVNRRKALGSLILTPLLTLIAAPFMGTAKTKTDHVKTALLKKWGNSPIQRHYINLGYLKSDDDVRGFGQFYIPQSAPLDLTEAEVRTCIDLCPLRREYDALHFRMNSRVFSTNVGEEDHLIVIPHLGNNRLPEQFSASRPMTRDRFKCGVEIFHTKLNFARQKYSEFVRKITPSQREQIEEQFAYYLAV